MKQADFISQLDSPTRLKMFLDKDASGEIYTLEELMDKVPGLKQRSSALRVSSNVELKPYVLFAATQRGFVRTFYGNPKVIEKMRPFVAGEGKSEARKTS